MSRHGRRRLLPSLTSRVVAGMLIVAFSTAIALSLIAALSASALWVERERATMRDTAKALAGAIVHEAEEENWPLRRAAPEAISESGVVGYRIEVWNEKRLVTSNLPGPTVGPIEENQPSDWILETLPLSRHLVLLVAAPRERSAEVARVFTRSLLMAIPVCLTLAVLVGRFIGRRATGPLSDFTVRLGALRPLETLPDLATESSPKEILELESAFRALWQRLDETVARELEFAANASHELRTSLTRIRLHAERARGGGLEGRAEIDAQLVELDRMVRLVDSLLVMSRDASTGIPVGEAVNLADIARAARSQVFGEDPLVVLEAPDEALLSGDEDLMRIAVENLLDNAKKFCRPGGRVLVSIEQADHGIRLTITNEGSGVPEADRSRIFERFYRGSAARADSWGHGLGLPLSRHIARLHGGELECVSQADEDARFVLEVPAWRPAAREGASRARFILR